MNIISALELSLEKNPDIKNPLEKGIASYTKCANAIKKDVEEILKKPVSVKTLIVYLKRKYENASFKRKNFRISSIELKDAYCYYVMPKGKRFTIPDKATVVYGVNYISLFVKKENRIRIDAIKKDCDLSAITIFFTEKEEKAVGFIAGILGMLAQGGINIEEIVSCHRELTIFVKSNYSAKAYEIIKRNYLKP